MSEPSHLPEQLLSFEMRMRQRRATRCLARAGTALDSGDLSGAESALAEARQLQPDSSELSTLEARLAALQPQPVDALAVDVVAAPARLARRRLTPWIATAAGLAVFATGAAFGARYWMGRSDQRARPQLVEAPPPVSVPAAATTGVVAASRIEQRLRIVHETVRAPEIAPRLLVAEPRLPSAGAPIAEPEPQPVEPEPVMLAVNRGANNPPPTIDLPPPRTEFRPDTRLDPVAAPPVVEPPNRAAIPTDPVAVPAARTTAPPPVEEASLTRDESSVVRSVLRRYESAFSNLDANEASEVWPAVNRGELARAFNGLTSQRVSLGSCDVTVTGAAARAICSGSATWEPKVGGGIRTESRRWSFDLRKNGDAWRIERAIAR